MFESVVYRYAANLEGEESEESSKRELLKVFIVDTLKYIKKG